MILSGNLALPQPIQGFLDERQRKIDALPNYEEKIEEAKNLWKKKDKTKFEEVRCALCGMSTVPRQCHYCEHSEADEVEHIYPKSWYPERTFLWENYLLSCGICNGSKKRDRFSIFDEFYNEIPLTRKRGQSATPPPSGSAVFINFRKENPLDFLTLDLKRTFCFTPRINQDDRSRRRAEFTIKTLDLNRSFLTVTRRNCFNSYCSLLKQYVTDKRSGTLGAGDQERKRDNIWKQCHAMVWQEIINKREEKGMEEINGLFRDAPELLTRPPFYFPVS